MGQQFIQVADSLGLDSPSSRSLTLNHSLEARLVKELSAQQVPVEISVRMSSVSEKLVPGHLTHCPHLASILPRDFKGKGKAEPFILSLF